MITTRLSDDGLISIPPTVLEAHHWHAGMELLIEDIGDAIVLRPNPVSTVRKDETGIVHEQDEITHWDDVD